LHSILKGIGGGAHKGWRLRFNSIQHEERQKALESPYVIYTYGDYMGVYENAFKNKELAAQILLPLIEFEFGFLGNDSPCLLQSPVNREQFEKIFEICKKAWMGF